MYTNPTASITKKLDTSAFANTTHTDGLVALPIRLELVSSEPKIMQRGLCSRGYETL